MNDELEGKERGKARTTFLKPVQSKISRQTEGRDRQGDESRGNRRLADATPRKRRKEKLCKREALQLRFTAAKAIGGIEI